MVTSTNPNETSGKAAENVKMLAYPAQDLPIGIRFRFARYSRFSPASEPEDRTTAIITMPMPLSASDRTGIRTSKEDLGAWGNMDLSMLNKAYSGPGQAFKDIWNTGQSIVTEEIERMTDNFKVSGLKALALNPMISDETRKSLGGFSGVVQNPHTNLLFDGVELRTHVFAWRLSPRSQQESDLLLDLTNTIKMHIYPEESFRGYALDYPDLVHAEYFGTPSTYLPKIFKGMVTEFNITHSTGGGIGFYKSGAPIDAEISMTINEMNIITRQRLRDGPEVDTVVT